MMMCKVLSEQITGAFCSSFNFFITFSVFGTAQWTNLATDQFSAHINVAINMLL